MVDIAWRVNSSCVSPIRVLDNNAGPSPLLASAGIGVFQGMLVAVGRGEVEDRHPAGCIVVVPAPARNHDHLASTEPARGFADHRELGFTGEDQQQLVASGVAFPRWPTGEGPDASRAAVKRELTDRTLWLVVRHGEVMADHPVDGVDAQIVQEHVVTAGRPRSG